MGIFSKREDYLDIPALQKKGIVKLPEPKINEDMKVTKDGYVELLDTGNVGNSESALGNNSNINPMAGFFDNSNPNNGASTSNNTPTFQSFWDTPVNSNSSTPSTSYFDNSTSSSGSTIYSGSDIQALKDKIENIEQKLDRILERLRY